MPGGRRKSVCDLLHARVKEFSDPENLTGCDLHLITHARETARADFELRNANGVLVGHAERELARHLGEQPPRAVAMALLQLRTGSSSLRNSRA